MSDRISNPANDAHTFDPPADLAAGANLKADAYERAAKDRLAFWAEQAERISWAEPFTEVLDWTNPPFARWFVDRSVSAIGARRVTRS
jgi:acetyl-CoA synthetase